MSIKIRDLILTKPQSQLDEGENIAAAGCHLVAPRGTAMSYDRPMSDDTHQVTVHFRSSSNHKLVIDGESLIDGPLEAGTIAFIPRSSRVQSEVTDGFDILQLFLPAWWLDNVLADFATRSIGRSELDLRPCSFHDEVLLHLAHAMVAVMGMEEIAVREFQYKAASYAFAARLITGGLLVSEPRQIVQGGLSHRKLHQLQKYMDMHLGEKLRIEELASLVGLSPSHFARAFKMSTSLPPLRYLQERRMHSAHGLLVNGGMSIGDVAAAVGYSDPSHFAEVFRKTFGVNPRQRSRSS